MSLFSIAYVGDFHCPTLNLDSVCSGLVPWILAHTNDGIFNIKIFASAGDIYEQNIAVAGANPLGWQINDMRTAFSSLTAAGILTVLCDGNHDNDDFSNPVHPPETLWNDAFPLSFFSSQSGYLDCMTTGDSSNLSMEYVNGSTKLLFLTYNHHDDPTLVDEDFINWYEPQTTWIKAQANANLGHNVIVMGHFFLSGRTRKPSYTEGIGGIFYGGPGRHPFDSGITSLPNLVMMLGGHERWSRKCHYVFRCDDGHQAVVSQFNTQSRGSGAADPWSGNGAYINLITFDTDRHIINFRTYDWVNEVFLTYPSMSFIANSQRYEIHDHQIPFAVPRQKLIIPITQL